MKFLMLFILILLLSGCALRNDREVIVIPCEVKLKERPTPKLDPLENLKEIFIYLEEIEEDLKFCKGGNHGR